MTEYMIDGEYIKKIANEYADDVFNESDYFFLNKQNELIYNIKEKLNPFRNVESKISFLHEFKLNYTQLYDEHQQECKTDSCTKISLFQRIMPLINQELDYLESNKSSVIKPDIPPLTVNYFENSSQNIVNGHKGQINSLNGQNNIQNVSFDFDNVKSIIESAKILIDDLKLSKDDAEEFNSEISRIETQLNRQSPKLSIIRASIKVLYDLTCELAGSHMSNTLPLLQTKFQGLISVFANM